MNTNADVCVSFVCVKKKDCLLLIDKARGKDKTYI
jgi:hypothetical protein